MVQLPTLDESQDAPLNPATGPLRYPSHIAGPGAVGDAIAGVGRQIEAQGIKEQQAKDETEYAAARSSYLVDKATLEAKLQDDPDWQNAPDKYREGMNTARETAAGTLTNPQSRSKFVAQASVETAQGLVPVLHMVRERQTAQDRGDLANLLDANQETALSSPQNSEAVVTATQAAISAAAAKGTISPAESVSMRRQWVESYGKSWLALQSAEDQVRVLTGVRSGTPTTAAMKTAILGQESGNNSNAPTSPTGAVGPGQVEPATFQRFALPGEDIKNPVDNRAVSGRYVDYLAKLPNVQGDPARIAVGYYSGEKNIAPAGSATPFIHDFGPKPGVKGPKTSEYVSQTLKRLGGVGPEASYDAGAHLMEKTGTPADFVPLPQRAVIAREADRQVKADGAGARAVFTDNVRDTIDYLHSGGDAAQAKVTPDQVRATIPGEEGSQLADELGHAFDYVAAARQVATAPESDLPGIINGRMPQGPEGFRASAAEASALFKAAQDRHKAIYGDSKTAGDPAAYANQNFPDVAKAYAAGAQDPSHFPAYVAKVRGAQTALGIPAEAQRVLPRADALLSVHNLQTGTPTEALGTLNALKKQSGAYWPQVYADLGRAGLPPAFQALSVISPRDAETMAAALGKDADARGKGTPMAESMRGVKYDDGSGKAPKSVTDLVDAQLARETDLQSLRGSYGIFGRAGASSFDSVYDAVRTTALYLFQTRGLSPQAAASQAAGMVTGPFDFVQQAGHAPLRLPKGASDNFSAAARSTMDGLKASDLRPLPVEMNEEGAVIPNRPVEERADQALTHARNAYWVAVPGADGKGAVRAIDPQSDTPVMVRSGEQAPAPSPQANFARNQAVTKPGAHVYNTLLTMAQETQFRQWVSQNHVPFDPNAKVSDYDMRGFWKALENGDHRAKSAVDANDGHLHYPDYWKTPYHQTFSNESQWATQNAPHWTADDKLITPHGTVVFDDRNRPQSYKPLEIPFSRMGSIAMSAAKAKASADQRTAQIMGQEALEK